MKLQMFQIDAFASEVFKGNPAAVVPLERWLPDATLQAIAAENNLAETAFFVPRGEGFHIRWMTPLAEVDLCGHATLASAYVLFDLLGHKGTQVRFESASGPLVVLRDGAYLTLDFPSRPPLPVEAPELLNKALGRAPAQVLAARDYFCVYEHEEDVRKLTPDMGLLAQLERKVIVTAPGTKCDFVSRFFAPTIGVPEDPVTGSAHCTLTPYWGERLKKDRLHAFQLSRRGGELFVEPRGDRVLISGAAVRFLEGTIHVP